MVLVGSGDVVYERRRRGLLAGNLVFMLIWPGSH